MALERVQATSLWRQSLIARENDPDAKYRDRLRSALLTMRENVIPFVRNIHHDVLGLTVHEETHLDALWDTASIIAGDQFEITPIEAFVFGASVLIHDTGLAIATYPGGIAELRETVIWRDAEAGARSFRTQSPKAPLTKKEEQNILFQVLRKLHAQQAEKLISFTFKRPGREESIPLLEDFGLHDALGEAIGRIAHSHHWSSADLAGKLVSVAGTVPGFPPEWTLNELKIACLLRCADAAHIDALRAPTMLFAITEVEGVSADHWTFQNKLNAVTRHNDKLYYYAGQSFSADEAGSWWLAYDTLQMIDNEIKSCNAILDDSGTKQFIVNGVHGVESPRLLSKSIRVDGWTPIGAEVKVSDPVHLARTLGGRNLYGSGPIAPVRELLQNAVDAVRARRAHQSREEGWGKIRLIIERSNSEPAETWLHVDDNGTGMSERVVTGPLIDFGKSFWSSTLLDEEFPGLRSHAPKIVGKFGIGFFAIFLLGDAVRVITRRFDAGDSSALVLSFDELTRRPLLRKAVTGELPLDYNTRVSVKLNDATTSQLGPQKFGGYRGSHTVSFAASLLHLIASADVDIEIIDRIHDNHYKHSGLWLNCEPGVFLEEVCALQPPNGLAHYIAEHQERIRLITESDGTVVGRAALALPGRDDLSGFVVSVGGFSSRRVRGGGYRGIGEVTDSPYQGTRSILGVLLGDTSDASRAIAAPTASPEAIARWAQEQDSLIDPSLFTPLAQVAICHRLWELGAESKLLPFAFLAGKFATVDECRRAISDSKVVDIPMFHIDYRNGLSFIEIEKLTTPYFTCQLHPTVIVASQSAESDLLTEDVRRDIIESGGRDLDTEEISEIFDSEESQYIAKIAREVWSVEPVYSIERVNLISGNASTGHFQSWVLRLRR